MNNLQFAGASAVRQQYDNQSNGYPTQQGNAANNLPTTDSPSKIRDGVTHIENQMSEVHGLISALESRLDTALTPSMPSPATNGQDRTPPPSPTSHLFDRLETLSVSLQTAQGRLQQLLSRIEV